HMRFRHAAVADRGLHGAGEIGGFAERLDGDARNGDDMPFAAFDRRFGDGGRGGEFHHGPTLLALPVVGAAEVCDAVSCPLAYFSITVWRRPAKAGVSARG